MAPPVRNVVIAAVILLGLLGGFILAFRPVATPPSTGVTTAPKLAKVAGRTKIPRVVKTNTGSASDLSGGDATSAVFPGRSAPPGGDSPRAPADGPVDKRENAGHGVATAAAIRTKMEDVTDEIAACLGEWMALDPTLEGKVSMGFQIGPDGLQDAWVEDHSDVPFGPQSCFGSAIYSADWTGVSDEPVEVTYPFVFTQGGQASGAAPG